MPDAPPPQGSAARWRPDARRAVLLVHDMQRYFVNFLPAGESPTPQLLANIGRAVRAARVLGVPVVYTAQPGGATRRQRGLLHDLWGPGMTAEPAHREIVPELAPLPGDLVLAKRRYSAFHRTGLAGWLTALRRDQLVVCGVFAHIGCLLTACDAVSHDIETFLLSDAVADFGPGEHAMALRYAAGICAVTLPTSRLLDQLAAVSAGGQPRVTRTGHPSDA